MLSIIYGLKQLPGRLQGALAHSSEHLRQLFQAGIPFKLTHLGGRSTSVDVFLNVEVELAKRRQLRQMGHAQNLVVAGQPP